MEDRLPRVGEWRCGNGNDEGRGWKEKKDPAQGGVDARGPYRLFELGLESTHGERIRAGRS